MQKISFCRENKTRARKRIISTFLSISSIIYFIHKKRNFRLLGGLREYCVDLRFLPRITSVIMNTIPSIDAIPGQLIRSNVIDEYVKWEIRFFNCIFTA